MSMRSATPLSSLAALTLVAALAITVSAQSPSSNSSQGATPPAGNAENGKKAYTLAGCGACHGLEGQGGPTTGPRLTNTPMMPLVGFSAIVRKPPYQMPPYTEKVLSEGALRDIYAFLLSRPRPAARTVLPD